MNRTTKLKSLIERMVRREIRKQVLRERKNLSVNEGLLDKIRSLLGRQEKEAQKVEKEVGKRIVGVDWDGNYIDEDGNIV